MTPPGLVLLCALLALSSRRALILTEFLPGTKHGPRGRLVRTAYRMLLNRTVLAVQVMTSWEADFYSGEYQIDSVRLRHVPFYSYDDSIEHAPRKWSPRSTGGVVSSGRNSCDWESVAQALAEIDCAATLICEGRQKNHVMALVAGNQRVTVLADVSSEEHDRLVENAQVFVLALKENGVSSGHVRLMMAATYGTPLVASRVRGIQGYENLVTTMVPANDSDALRSAIADVLLSKESLLDETERVRRAATTRSRSVYSNEMVEFIRRGAESR